MPSFFMHQVNDGARFDDVEGYDRTGRDQMRAEAFLAGRKLMGAQIRKGRRPDFEAFFDITIEAGGLLARVLFRDTLGGANPHAATPAPTV